MPIREKYHESASPSFRHACIQLIPLRPYCRGAVKQVSAQADKGSADLPHPIMRVFALTQLNAKQLI
ncbi:MAG: hypothetical protein L0L66_08835, partial [Bifidobacterium crudilactis]|nr:hypothetical protein [Bifidobacterium crudilactis]